MPTTNLVQADSQLLEQTTRHSVMLERLKAGEVKKFEKYLRQIDTLVREQLTRKELTTYSRDRLEQFLLPQDEVGHGLAFCLVFAAQHVVEARGQDDLRTAVLTLPGLIVEVRNHCGSFGLGHLVQSAGVRGRGHSVCP